MTPGFALIWLTAVIAGGIIGHRKGRLPMGIVWSLILSWLGVVIIALMPKTEERRILEAQQPSR